MSQQRILIVEDDIDSAEVLAAYLKRDNFLTQHAVNGMQALELHTRWRPDLVLLDIMLPGLNGNEVLGAIRQHAPTPVIMVTAVGGDTQRISALLYGADDYVVKPYNPSEVVARVYAVLRRWAGQALPKSGRLRHGALVIDLDAALAATDLADGTSRPLDLTRTEFQLLSLLMAAPSKMFSRSELLTACLPESDAMERVVDAHMYNLRRKLEVAGITGVLVTVRGLGYRFWTPLMNTRGKRRSETLWRWISVRMIALAFIALALVGGGMWYRYSMWNADLRKAIPEPIREELQLLEAAPDENQARLRQIYGEYLYGDYFAPAVIQEDMLFFAILVVLALPLVVAGGVWVSLRLSRQLSAVALSAGEIAQGDFTSRAPLMAHTPPGLQTLTTDFNEMAERLQRYDRELQESSAAIAHELRTPLTAAIGRLQGILDGVFQAEPEQLKTVMRQLHHLSRLTDDLHLLSMAHVGKLELHLCEFKIMGLCEERVSWATPSLDAAGMRVHLQMSERLTLLADRDRVGQLLSVLIENALRYAATGGQLVLRAHREQDELVLAAEDRGPGFTAEHLDRVCERFWRAESSRSRHAGGSGLGLSIASAICVAHGGSLTVHNLSEGGARILARLPLRSKIS